MASCTIVIPTRNRDDLLVRAVRSALTASPQDGEVLVVDDRSVVPASQVLACIQDRRLRVISNQGRSGAATARNVGVASASGEWIFFLDDDDEIIADYCSRVLEPGGGAAGADWGFSSIVERREDAKGDSVKGRKRLLRGITPQAAHVRDTVAAMGDGFWIRRSTFTDAGGLDPAQTIDEDTDLCMRLLARNSRPWYEPMPGMVVYRGYAPARPDGAQLTVATPAEMGLQCYRRTHDKNVAQFGPCSEARWFLATRYLRRAIKAGRVEEARRFARAQTPSLYSVVLRAYVCIKRLMHR